MASNRMDESKKWWFPIDQVFRHVQAPKFYLWGEEAGDFNRLECVEINTILKAELTGILVDCNSIVRTSGREFADRVSARKSLICLVAKSNVQLNHENRCDSLSAESR